MLNNAGYRTSTAKSAIQARQMLEEGDFDAMTLDLCLPDQDGIALVKELRRNPETQSLPIVVVSAQIHSGQQELNGDAVGLIEWLKKPVDPKLLVERLGDALKHAVNAKPRILYVEDIDSVLQIVSALVDNSGDVVAARTVKEATALLEHETFDLVILDLTLPDGNGESLLPLLNKPDGLSIPVIVFSADDVSRKTAEKIEAALVKTRTSNEMLLNTIRSTIKATRAA